MISNQHISSTIPTPNNVFKPQMSANHDDAHKYTFGKMMQDIDKYATAQVKEIKDRSHRKSSEEILNGVLNALKALSPVDKNTIENDLQKFSNDFPLLDIVDEIRKSFSGNIKSGVGAKWYNGYLDSPPNETASFYAKNLDYKAFIEDVLAPLRLNKYTFDDAYTSMRNEVDKLSKPFLVAVSDKSDVLNRFLANQTSLFEKSYSSTDRPTINKVHIQTELEVAKSFTTFLREDFKREKNEHLLLMEAFKKMNAEFKALPTNGIHSRAFELILMAKKISVDNSTEMDLKWVNELRKGFKGLIEKWKAIGKGFSAEVLNTFGQKGASFDYSNPKTEMLLKIDLTYTNNIDPQKSELSQFVLRRDVDRYEYPAEIAYNKLSDFLRNLSQSISEDELKLLLSGKKYGLKDIKNISHFKNIATIMLSNVNYEISVDISSGNRFVTFEFSVTDPLLKTSFAALNPTLEQIVDKQHYVRVLKTAPINVIRYVDEEKKKLDAIVEQFNGTPPHLLRSKMTKLFLDKGAYVIDSDTLHKILNGRADKTGNEFEDVLSDIENRGFNVVWWIKKDEAVQKETTIHYEISNGNENVEGRTGKIILLERPPEETTLDDILGHFEKPSPYLFQSKFKNFSLNKDRRIVTYADLTDILKDQLNSSGGKLTDALNTAIGKLKSSKLEVKWWIYSSYEANHKFRISYLIYNSAGTATPRFTEMQTDWIGLFEKSPAEVAMDRVKAAKVHHNGNGNGLGEYLKADEVGRVIKLNELHKILIDGVAIANFIKRYGVNARFEPAETSDGILTSRLSLSLGNDMFKAKIALTSKNATLSEIDSAINRVDKIKSVFDKAVDMSYIDDKIKQLLFEKSSKVLDEIKKLLVAGTLLSSIPKIVEKYKSEIYSEFIDAVKASNIDKLRRDGEFSKEELDKLEKNIKKIKAGIGQVKLEDFEKPATALLINEFIRNAGIEYDNISPDTVSKIIERMRSVTLGMKIGMVSLGGIMGLGGLIGLSNAVKISSTNKKARATTNGKIKMRSPRKMMLLSLFSSTVAIASSVGIMLYIFVAKGGF